MKCLQVMAFIFVLGGVSVGNIASAATVTYETVPTFGAVGDFVVGPGKVEYTIEPGATREATLIITNRLGERSTFELSVEDIVGSNDPQQAVRLLGNDRGPYSLMDYISFPVEKVKLEHGQRARVPVTITVPTDAEPGGHYGSVLVSVISDETVLPSDGTSASPRSVVVSRVGALYFVTVPGEVSVSGALDEFGVISNDRILTTGPVSFEVLYKNTGSVHLSPHGEIAITNMFGTTIDRLTLEPWYVMPGSSRYLEAKLDRRWLFGFYRVELNLARGYDDQFDTAALTFIAIPRELIWSFVALFVLVLGYVGIRRWRTQPKLSLVY